MRLRAYLLLLWLAAPPPAQAEDWPQFRGPDGQGRSTARGLPAAWSEGQHVAWKSPVPGHGWSSPTVQGTEVWLTTALDGGRSLRALCLDLRNGQLLRDVEVFSIAEPGPVHSKNSHASPTPWLEGDRVYLHFGAHGTACLHRDGRVLWRCQELKYKHGHGPGGSPVVWNDLLLISCDGTDVQFLAALDKHTGQVRWRQHRAHISEKRKSGAANVPMAYSTPLLIEVQGQPQLLCAVSDHVVAYEPSSGEEIWWARYDGYSNVVRPAFGQGLVFVSSGYDSPQFYAWRADGRGDVTDSHLAWKSTQAAPLNPSPLLVGEELFLVSDDGVASCLDALTGAVHWKKRLGGNFSASPLFADGRVYFLDEAGTTTVVAASREYERLAVNQLAGRTLASLAVAGRALLLRTDTHLYRLESP
jgi:outer membrane protein assembly factor BamB